MKQIEAPDGSIIEFPPEMPDEEIEAVLKQNFPSESKPGYLESAIRGAAQGATLDFGDEIGAGLTAPALYAKNQLMGTPEEKAQSVGDIYNETRQMTDDANKAASESNPLTYGSGYVGGAVGASVLGAGTGAGKAAGRLIQSSGLPARVGLSSIAGGLTGGVLGAGSAQPGERLDGAGQGAVVGGAIGAALPVAGAAIKGAAGGVSNLRAGIKSENIKTLVDDAGEIKDFAGATLDNMRRSKQGLKQEAAMGLVANIKNEVSGSVKLNAKLHANYLETIKDLEDLASNGEVEIADLANIRLLLEDSIKKDGKGGPAAMAAKRAFDDFLPKIPDDGLTNGGAEALADWKNGMTNYAKAKGLEDIADNLKKAQGDPERFRRGLIKALDNPKLAGRFTPSEISALRNAATAGDGEKLIRLVGKTGFDLGSDSNKGRVFNALISASLGGVGAGSFGVAAVIPAIGTGANYLQKKIALGKLDKAVEQIVNRTTRAADDGLNPRIKSLKSRIPKPEPERVTALRNEIDRRLKGSAWDQYTEAQKNLVDEQVELAFKNKPGIDIEDAIRSAKDTMKSIAESKGVPFRETSMSAAFGRVKPDLATKIPKNKILEDAFSESGKQFGNSQKGLSLTIRPTKNK